MQEKFLKSLIYVLIASLAVIFLLIQPYNLYCKIKKTCQPFFITSIFKKYEIGKEEMTVLFSSETPVEIYGIVSFKPSQESLKVLNGKNIVAHYTAKNLSQKTITIKSEYRIEPAEFDDYLERIECLCFKSQTLKPNEEVQMPINFIINPKVETDEKLKNIKEIKVIYKVNIT